MTGGLFLFSVTANCAERIEEQVFPVNANADFFLKTHRGDVQIRTADVDNIRVVATFTHEDEDALDRVALDTSASRDRVHVGVDFEEYDFRYWQYWRDGSPYPEVSFVIVTPRTVSLDIDSHRSELDIEAPTGEVRIKAHRGQGNISAIRSDFILDTHRGDFDLAVDELHDLDIKTHRGNVYARIDKAENYRISGDSDRGSLRFPGSNIRVRSDDSRGSSVNERVGSGENQIVLDTHRGDITLAFND
jgi:hypothetical protein